MPGTLLPWLEVSVTVLSFWPAVVPFTGHAVCSSGPWLNGLNLFNSTESYHPNRNGHALGYVPLARSVVG